jgi:hypothetical protein
MVGEGVAHHEAVFCIVEREVGLPDWELFETLNHLLRFCFRTRLKLG